MAQQQAVTELKPQQTTQSLNGLAVERYEGLESHQAIPWEPGNQNWFAGKKVGKSEVLSIFTCSSPPCLVVTSLGPERDPVTNAALATKRQFRVAVPTSNLKSWQLKE